MCDETLFLILLIWLMRIIRIFVLQLEKQRKADQELKKRVLKLEFCLQEARSQTRKLQRVLFFSLQSLETGFLHPLLSLLHYLRWKLKIYSRVLDRIELLKERKTNNHQILHVQYVVNSRMLCSEQMGDRRDKALKELRGQLSAKHQGDSPGGSSKQNFWETPRFKIVVSMSMLVLVIFSRRWPHQSVNVAAIFTARNHQRIQMEQYHEVGPLK